MLFHTLKASQPTPERGPKGGATIDLILMSFEVWCRRLGPPQLEGGEAET